LAQSIGDFFADLQFRPAKAAQAAPIGFGAKQALRFAPLGQRR
jgi:hypothetical protein